MIDEFAVMYTVAVGLDVHPEWPRVSGWGGVGIGDGVTAWVPATREIACDPYGAVYIAEMIVDYIDLMLDTRAHSNQLSYVMELPS